MYSYQDLFDSYPDTAIVFDSEALISFELLIRELKVKSIAAFTGQASADASGAWPRFLKACWSIDIEVVRFYDIEPEPGTQTVAKMVKFLCKHRPDAVVALGGGSPMDAAKAAYLTYQAGGAVNNYFGINKFSSANPKKKLKKVICFPTTSGTGSEATPYANIVDKKLQVKKLIIEDQIIPEYSFVMPEFAATMPPGVTLATGCDALAHSLEGFLNVGQDGRHPQANDWAKESIRLLVKNLPEVLQDGSDLATRAAVSAAATLGGMVIRYKSTGLPHLCSFSWFGHIAHGLAVAMTLPAAWRYYIGSDRVQERTMELSDIFPGTSPAEVIKSYREFLDSIGVPDKLKVFPGLTPQLLESSIDNAAENRMKLSLAPRPVPFDSSREILVEIITEAYGKNF